MRRLKILHHTQYNFSGSVHLGPHRLLLRPREGAELRIESMRLETWPPARMRWLRDADDNAVAIAAFEASTTQLQITSEAIVTHFDDAPLDFLVEDYALNYPFNYEADTRAVLQPYLFGSQGESVGVRAWVEGYWRSTEPIQTYVLLARLCLGINRSFLYRMREEPGVQTATQTLARGVGSCRDFATLFLEAARSLGLAARFVSGYLNAPALPGQSGATHAWAEVYLPGAGWKGFDPTNGEVAGSGHIAVAVARDPDTVSPVTGCFFGPVGAELLVSVNVSEL